MSASIKLRFFDEHGVAKRSKRFSMSDDSSTVAESMQKGLDSLECPYLQCQLNMYGQSRDRLEDSIRVPATVPTSMAATSPPSTPIAMAAPPPPYDRVLMDDGSAEPSTSAAASNERPIARLEDSILVPPATPTAMTAASPSANTTAMAGLIHFATPTPSCFARSRITSSAASLFSPASSMAKVPPRE